MIWGKKHLIGSNITIHHRPGRSREAEGQGGVLPRLQFSLLSVFVGVEVGVGKEQGGGLCLSWNEPDTLGEAPHLPGSDMVLALPGVSSPAAELRPGEAQKESPQPSGPSSLLPPQGCSRGTLANTFETISSTAVPNSQCQGCCLEGAVSRSGAQNGACTAFLLARSAF